jgi:hypothetical protein
MKIVTKDVLTIFHVVHRVQNAAKKKKPAYVGLSTSLSLLDSNVEPTEYAKRDRRESMAKMHRDTSS